MAPAAAGKWPAEKHTVFRRLVELPLGKEELDVGGHVCVFRSSVCSVHALLTPHVLPIRSFAFRFDIPSTVMIHQETPYGNVLYNGELLLFCSLKNLDF